MKRIELVESAKDFAYAVYPTNHKHIYNFPFGGVHLKSSVTKGRVPANFVQMTRAMAWFQIDRVWWRFDGPRVKNFQEPRDRHWKWARFVRKLRQSEWLRCVAVRTEDGAVQGAAIFERAGASNLEEGERAAYIHYLAAAPGNRRDFAQHPSYYGIGEGLLTLIVAQSYDWGYGGRVVLYSLPGALGFYKKFDFVETGERFGDIIHLELPPTAAEGLLEKVEVI